MQISEGTRLAPVSLPPMHIWPAPLKRATSMLAIAACLGVYIVLAGRLLAAIVFFFE